MDLKQEIQMLRQRLEALDSEYHRNNFEGGQDFNKYSRFNTRLKIPKYDTLPATCEVGEIVEDGGVLKICSAANTWTTVGTQT
jgi:hypothetical protein